MASVRKHFKLSYRFVFFLFFVVVVVSFIISFIISIGKNHDLKKINKIRFFLI